MRDAVCALVRAKELNAEPGGRPHLPRAVAGHTCPLRARSKRTRRGAAGSHSDRARKVQVSVSPGQAASAYAIFQTGAPRAAHDEDDVLVDHLPVDVRAALRFFAFYIANGTLDVDLLEGIDYRPQLMAFGSPLEQVFAIFANVLQVNENGEVLNEGDAHYRAAQWVRSYCDPSYEVEPPFEHWEIELHGP